MRIGTLNRRIKLQRPVETQVAGGAMVKTWEDVATIWARVSYLSGLETVKANTPISISKASIKIRFREGVDARWRALDGSVIFSILNVLPDAEGREHVFLACETGANDG